MASTGGMVVSRRLGGLGVPAVVVHGGAGSWRGLDEDLRARVLEVVERAALQGLSAARRNVFDVLVEAVRVLEDSGVFNAGLGSVLTYDGRVEMDAGLMDGGFRGGGVGAVSYPRNPIVLARVVAEKTAHVLLVGEAADRLAERLGLEKHPGPSERALERWKKARSELEEGRGPDWARRLRDLYGGHETVGAVAVLSGGVTGAATSTGGIVLKAPGRVGDSAIPGAGFYALNSVGACAATGIGETIILGRPCIHALELLRAGVPVEEAARAAVARHTSTFGANNLGIILVDAWGNAAAAMNTEAMPVGYAGPEKKGSLILSRRAPGEASENP